MPIRLLEDNLINKIAAGEVIERPASVVKELVENSIDAGSTRINVRIAGGGVDLIEVEDNGFGIPAQDVGTALQRHATSKITCAEDLFNINTMGFRGEALPSIASVSRLELYTRYADEPGARVTAAGGTIQDTEAFPGPEGTRIVVRELFFNTPVRKKFLKSPVTEQSHIYDIMSKLALSRPDISFSLNSEKKLYFKTPGNGNLRDALIAINGKDFAEQFIDLKISGETCSAYGLITRPEFHRINRKNQIFYVNNRIIKSPMLARAVDEGYKGLLLSREYPGVIVFLTIAPGEVDINVHPQKTELRFTDEGPIFRLLSRGIRDTVNGLAINWRENYRETQAPTEKYYDLSYIEYPRTIPAMVRDQEIPFVHQPSKVFLRDLSTSPAEVVDDDEYLRILGQCFNSYILVETEGCLWMVDQHAAHERIIYSRLKKAAQSGEPETQLLAVPLTIELSVPDIELIIKQPHLLSKIGLFVEPLGPDTLIIRSSPPALQGQEKELLLEILQMLRDNRNDDCLDAAQCLLACKRAVKAGQILSSLEMEQLLKDLLETDDFRHCPHGRPTIIEITHSELDRRFKR